MMNRRNFMLCIGALPLAGCMPLESHPSPSSSAVPEITSQKRKKVFVVPSYGHSSLAQAQHAVDFAKKHYPDYKLISTGSTLAGNRYDEIVVHADVWRSDDPRVVTWIYYTLRTRLPPGGRYVELGK